MIERYCTIKRKQPERASEDEENGRLECELAIRRQLPPSDRCVTMLNMRQEEVFLNFFEKIALRKTSSCLIFTNTCEIVHRMASASGVFTCILPFEDLL